MGYRSRERVRRILSHKNADRVPHAANQRQELRDLVSSMDLGPEHREFAIEGDFAYVHLEPPVNKEIFTPYLKDLPKEAVITIWGIGEVRQYTQDGYDAGVKMFHPLKNVNSVEELKKYPFPDIAKDCAGDNLEKEVNNFKKQEYTVLGQMSQTILETAYCMRGMIELFCDFFERPEYVEFLFEKIAEQRRYQAKRLAESGVDILRIGDDIATQEGLLVNPELYREKIKPVHRSIIDSARKVNSNILVKYHSDGNLTPLLPDLIDIGINIINPVQAECMDLRGVKKEFGKDLAFWGCMPVQSIIAFGAPEELLHHMRFLMKDIAADGGLVIGFNNLICTKKAVQNMRYFIEEFYKVGRYDNNY